MIKIVVMNPYEIFALFLYFMYQECHRATLFYSLL